MQYQYQESIKHTGRERTMDLMEFINVFISMDPTGSNPLANLLLIVAGVAALGLLLASMAGNLTHDRSSRAVVKERTTPEDLKKAA
jgi:hypothetical protein